ncbi:MAG TPA: hypothetical protein VGC80_19300 [Acetobacteraceae bacterium]|jgi:hypothetical protein
MNGSSMAKRKRTLAEAMIAQHHAAKASRRPDPEEDGHLLRKLVAIVLVTLLAAGILAWAYSGVRLDMVLEYLRQHPPI